ncbi:MAG: glucosamine-6-phosphate deaminase [Bacteroidetes bacterium]|nr:MAG: glucosamine-6-phosphate deaminase [Bacteroidota bacterium]
MTIRIADSVEEMGRQAALEGSALIRQAINEKGSARIILATGASQFKVLKHLVQEEIDWAKVTGFHLDEYIDLPLNHPASFRKYLKERFVDLVPIGTFHYINGEHDPAKECRKLGELIAEAPVDVAFVGIGENGHLAFNDPPADFETEEAYLVVELDELCRQQQLGEGWFEQIGEVPGKAISMSVRQIMKSRHIICSVPDARKAKAVKATVEGEIGPMLPASVLRRHPRTHLFLDREAASLLSDS